MLGTSLLVQQLRLHTPNAGGQGLILRQGTRACRSQLKILRLLTKIPHVATKTRRSKKKKKKKNTDARPIKSDLTSEIRISGGYVHVSLFHGSFPGYFNMLSRLRTMHRAGSPSKCIRVVILE